MIEDGTNRIIITNKAGMNSLLYFFIYYCITDIQIKIYIESFYPYCIIFILNL